MKRDFTSILTAAALAAMFWACESESYSQLHSDRFAGTPNGGMPRIEIMGYSALEEWKAENAAFEKGAIPALLLEMGMLWSREEYWCKDGELYGGEYDASRHFLAGSQMSKIIFFGNGTCWSCYFGDSTGASARRWRYLLYNWDYDAASSSIVTWKHGGGRRSYARVMAVSEGMLLLDGELCDNVSVYSPPGADGSGIYLRMAMYPAPADTRRFWVDNAVRAGR